MKIKSLKDFWSGIMFVVISLLFIFAARNYEMGSSSRMGPAYFPTALAVLMAILGSVLLLRSFLVEGVRISRIYIRPLFFVTISILSFAFFNQLIGLLISVTIMVLISIIAGHDFTIKEVVIISIILPISSVLLFVYGLRIVLPVWPPLLY
jgi:hypothetical protein